MPDEPPEPVHLPTDDLDAGLRDRLRHARGDAELTRDDLLELADALAAQRRELAEAVADLTRREAEAAAMRDTIERASREAAQELDERDTRLAALANELMLERTRLERRERDLRTAERRAQQRAESQPAPRDEADAGKLEAIETAVHDLRDRLERVETTLAARVARVLDVVEEIARGIRAPLERVVAVAHGQPEDRAREAVSHAPVPPEAAPQESLSPEPPTNEVPPPQRDSSPAPPSAAGYVLFVETTAGYRLFERDGPAPAPGTRFAFGSLAGEELSGAELEAGATRRSPLPGDPRPCIVCAVASRTSPTEEEPIS